MGSPPATELVAAGGQLTNQVGKSPVIGMAASLGVQQGDSVVDDPVPVAEELGRARREDEPGAVGWPDRFGIDRQEQREAKLVGGQDVKTSIEQERGRADHRVEGALHTGPDPLRAGRRGARVVPAARIRSRRWLRSASSSCRARVMPSMTLPETPVALPRSAWCSTGSRSPPEGRPRRRAAPRPVGGLRVYREPGLYGGDLGPARAQELPDLPANVATDVVAVCHAFHPTGAPPGLRVPVSNPIIRDSRSSPPRGSVANAPPLRRWVLTEIDTTET
jgi:hypothetical protein